MFSKVGVKTLGSFIALSILLVTNFSVKRLSFFIACFSFQYKMTNDC